jgi:hypothetical protein
LYGNAHEPASDLSITLGFADTLTMKVWLASAAVLFALVQAASALWLYGRLGARPAVGGGAVWTADFRANTVTRIDPAAE